MEATEDTLLGGRVSYAQFRGGFRSGIEPVLLAASVPARPDESVLDAGTGAGAALLCLAARLPGVRGIGIEHEAELAALAARNVRRNRWSERLHIIVADLTRAPLPACSVDHVMSNPPYHLNAGTPSPETLRTKAKQAPFELFAAWLAACAACVRPRGTITLVLPAAHYVRAGSALAECGCGGIALFPLWRRGGEAAKLVLIRGVAGSRGPAEVRPGLVLHTSSSTFTPEADGVLRDGLPLAW